MYEQHKSIGLIDSGVGGLTVLRELRQLLPGENIVYYGDTEHMPYGPRKQTEVRKFVTDIIKFLYTTQDVKMVIVACNTATVVGLERYQETVPVPVLGVVEPGARGALEVTRNKRIGLIATEGTVNSNAYQSIITALDAQAQVYSIACPLFALIVENQFYNNPETGSLVNTYLDPLRDKDIDSLILGCTHYPMLSKAITLALNSDITLVDPAVYAARMARDLLVESGLVNDGIKGWQRFFVSREPGRFRRFGCDLLGYAIDPYRVTIGSEIDE